jgi:hypothetical protein
MGKFVIKKSTDGKFFFRLQAGNGENILASEMYEAKASCLNGIESVKRNASNASLFEKKNSTNGQPYFVLKAGNHEVIGTSEMYSGDSARDNGIQSVMANAAGATTDDQTGG